MRYLIAMMLGSLLATGCTPPQPPAPSRPTPPVPTAALKAKEQVMIVKPMRLVVA